MVVKIQVEMFWAVTLCNVVVGCPHFGERCCLHLQGEVNGVGEKSVCVCVHMHAHRSGLQEGSRVS
jgi:hypothetical protein